MRVKQQSQIGMVKQEALRNILRWVSNGEKTFLTDPDGILSRRILNLGWLLQNWKEITEFDIIPKETLDRFYPADESRSFDVVLIGSRRNGSFYVSRFSSSSILEQWLDRPVFRGVPVHWHSTPEAEEAIIYARERGFPDIQAAEKGEITSPYEKQKIEIIRHKAALLLEEVKAQGPRLIKARHPFLAKNMQRLLLCRVNRAEQAFQEITEPFPWFQAKNLSFVVPPLDADDPFRWWKFLVYYANRSEESDNALSLLTLEFDSPLTSLKEAIARECPEEIGKQRRSPSFSRFVLPSQYQPVSRHRRK